MDWFDKACFYVSEFEDFVVSIESKSAALYWALMTLVTLSLIFAVILAICVWKSIKRGIIAVFCLLFRRHERVELENCRQWLADRYRSGDVMWHEQLWKYCSWKNNFLLVWPKGHATRKAVYDTQKVIDKMKSQVNSKKKAHWLEYKAKLPYVYSKKEMESRAEVKKAVEQYKMRLWRVRCVALFEYNEVFIYRILCTENVISLPKCIDEPVLRFEYDEVALVKRFVPWLQDLERSYEDIEQTVGKKLRHDNLDAVLRRCEENFFSIYYKFGEEVPIPPEYDGVIVDNPIPEYLRKSFLLERLKWWFFRRHALGISRAEDDNIVLRNVEWNFKILNYAAEEEARKEKAKKEQKEQKEQEQQAEEVENQ